MKALSSENETLRIHKGASLAAVEMTDRIAVLEGEREDALKALEESLIAINTAYGITGENQFIDASVAARTAITKLEGQ